MSPCPHQSCGYHLEGSAVDNKERRESEREVRCEERAREDKGGKKRRRKNQEGYVKRRCCAG
jgi:hypothetical protein